MAEDLPNCPKCRYVLLGKPADCPYCGYNITYPTWKKVGAWILLFFVAWFLVRCHLELFEIAGRTIDSGGPG